MLKVQVLNALQELKEIDPETRIDQRIEKFASMGRWIEENQLT
jgi:acetyl-CoA carboxylase carboxyl transferase subunit alpha